MNRMFFTLILFFLYINKVHETETPFFSSHQMRPSHLVGSVVSAGNIFDSVTLKQVRYQH